MFDQQPQRKGISAWMDGKDAGIDSNDIDA